MFRVELLPSASHAQPGWSYVADRGFDPSKAALAPTHGRKRGIRDAGKGGDISSRRANAIARHIAELDRENQRDVSIPVPVKQAKEAGARKTREKTTSNVRRILQSQKTFKNHLDDEEAAIAAGGGGIGAMQGAGGGGSGGGSGGGGGGNANAAVKGAGKAAVAAAIARRSSTPMTAPSTPVNPNKKKRSAASVTVSSTPTQTPAPTPTPQQDTTMTDADADVNADANTENDAEGPRQKLLKTEHDDDPLLRSYTPNMPSERIMQLLLAEPPLSYNTSRAAPPDRSQPPRSFCCMCGYWGKIRCKNCHVRTCGLDCYRLHEDSRCGAFF